MSQRHQLPFVTLDVFTTTAYEGNPLAVIHIPPGLNPPINQAQKQAIAREFNLSETVFVHDIDETVEKSHSRKIDIFLTNAEIPFAGHPTIGAATHLRPFGVTEVITKAGPIPIQEGGGGKLKAQVPFNTRIHARTLGDLTSLVGPLNANPEIAAAEKSAKFVSIVPGMTFAVIELPSLEHLAQLSRGPFALRKDEVLDEGWRDTFAARYYFVRLGSENGVEKVRTRMIEVTLEDPATGSAASALGCYLAEAQGSSWKGEITQGVEMGRRSDISLEVSFQDGKVQEVLLGGTAVEVMKGTLTAPLL